MKKRNLSFVIVIVVLLVLHGLSDNLFRVDATSVLLLLILILLPYLKYVKRIKYGNFEAEITPEEVRKIEKQVEKIPEKKQKKVTTEKPNILKDLVESDPPLALAKARIEIEKRIRSLEQVYVKEKKKGKFSLTGLVENLSEKEVIDEPLETLLIDVITVANRAVHGEYVSQEDAIRLVDIANRVLKELDYVVINHALKSGRVKEIDQKEAKNYIDGEYIVKTVIPYVKKPEMRTYHLNQTELDTFLEGYYENSEFIVSIERKK